eukprot:47737-Pelagomonas_calceolata.AAC.1
MPGLSGEHAGKGHAWNGLESMQARNKPCIEFQLTYSMRTKHFKDIACQILSSMKRPFGGGRATDGRDPLGGTNHPPATPPSTSRTY